MKRNLVGIFAVLLAIGFSSFTSKRAFDKWFSFSGTNSQALEPNRYTDIGSSAPPNPSDVNFVLAYIHVETSSEVYPAGDPMAGKPKVDLSTTAIYSALVAHIVPPATPTEVANRIFLR